MNIIVEDKNDMCLLLNSRTQESYAVSTQNALTGLFKQLLAFLYKKKKWKTCF